ncbi:hypothetical protein EMIHUDRAFT_232232 [Emiliania huxleyi CCMP1516]|uniref:Uncharacterized protein n=2 Tax=Emiliania huxleyi TaxID=2903 RepID=A0A0D3K683_EMIH1|nr:hypothetical protein EMIHUDRAFT_232232 [Emiliania huxleyi CCMP1516]EOD31268.1 hypothetical protein EMIHUDRAFT_232232 [Emiliania huxleyi CCMP1516]|eukprot:XP_005783697.1 hypothetical protein EMIHUDRAFT_232232 [Emiliania huxleyi CCMP1516]
MLRPPPGRRTHASDDLHQLFDCVVDSASKQHWRRIGARSAKEARSYFATTLRRAWGVHFAREFARHRIRRVVTPSALNVKFKDSLSSNPEDVGQRGAFVGLGNTEPGTSADVFGLEQRGAVGDGDFRPSDGGGYMYLFETFGGWCNAVKRLFYQMKDKVRNKLSKRQHEDEASWSTRSWLLLQAQRMSVALQLAAAEEIATELRLAAASEDAAVA